MPDVDCIQMLVFAALPNENLIIQIIQIVRYKQMNILHDFQHIVRLFDCLRGQMVFDRFQMEFLRCQNAHLAICSPVVHLYRRQIVEHLADLVR